MTLYVMIGFFAWIVARSFQVRLTVARLAVLGALFTLIVGSVIGVLLQIEFAASKEILPSGAFAAHPATQVVGYLVLENGVFIFGLGLAGQQPIVVELSVLLDVLVGVFVMGIAINHISQTFDHIDTPNVTQARGLMVDRNGFAWVAGNNSCALVKVDVGPAPVATITGALVGISSNAVVLKPSSVARPGASGPRVGMFWT